VAIAGADATAAVELWWTLAGALRLDDVSLQASPHRGLHRTRTALIVAGPERRAMGVVGEIDPDVLAAHDIPGRVAYMGADMTWLLEEIPRRPDAMAPISRFPASDIDLAFETPDSVPAAGVADALRAAAGEVLEDLKLFDVYRSDLLGHGVRSLAYRLRFRSLDHTLTLDEVGDVRRRCIEAAEALGARLRA